MVRTIESIIIGFCCLVSIILLPVFLQNILAYFCELNTKLPILNVYLIGLIWIFFLPLFLYTLSIGFDKIVDYNIGNGFRERIIRILWLIIHYIAFSIPVLIAVAINSYSLNLLKIQGNNIEFIFLLSFLSIITIRYICYPDANNPFNQTISTRIKDFFFSFIAANITIALFIISYYLYIDQQRITDGILVIYYLFNQFPANMGIIFLLYAIDIIMISVLAEIIRIYARPHFHFIGIVIWSFVISFVIVFVGFALLGL